eukprot:CAMPEP_0201281960 /NCGR_PEP_ID=MMETSP1317-20130820/4543_1 /ASSEMBLY_ACC=CAM_ASM_000770 /TAXON_ID=187299 /ORGANISM="Undescribed Undescribed, Strain Undescribed" /LENGTH=36 /DNA_ID= /DNA_START= /DNA_END= /DNA_ORIENTATION=
MTDNTPLVKIKQGMQQLRNEIRVMELRSGVVSHGLL